MDHVFKSMQHVEEAQILQTTPEAIEIVFVPGPGFDSASESKLRKEVGSRLGDKVAVELRAVTEIARESNGKLRAVKSSVGRLGP